MEDKYSNNCDPIAVRTGFQWEWGINGQAHWPAGWAGKDHSAFVIDGAIQIQQNHTVQ